MISKMPPVSMKPHILRNIFRPQELELRSMQFLNRNLMVLKDTTQRPRLILRLDQENLE
jgi:hypothetical protein